MTHNIKRSWYYLYLFDHKLQNKYVGYIDLLQFIDFEPPHDRVELLKPQNGFPLDYTFLPSSPNTKGCQSETLFLTCLDSMYVIGLNRISDKWERLHKVMGISGID